MARARSPRYGLDPWPGYVDVLSTLLLVIVFLLSIFVLAQFFLTNTLSGQDKALKELSLQLEQLSNDLALERKRNTDLSTTISQLQASLGQIQAERDALATTVGELENKFQQQQDQTQQAQKDLSERDRRLNELEALRSAAEDKAKAEAQISNEAKAQVQVLNQQILELRRQLARLEAALDAAAEKDKKSEAQIADLGRRLNLALAQKVEELSQYRSEFFGELRKALGNRPDIQVVGDRFVLQSEVLFEIGSADLSDAAKQQLVKIAEILLQVSQRIPERLPWVLRVDGHSDPTPIRTAQFASNWELSTARAVAVTKFLITQGILPTRIAAAGFGEFQPLDQRTDEIGNRRNRRIELKLTEK